MNTMRKAAIAVRLSAVLSCARGTFAFAFAIFVFSAQGQPITNVQALINQVMVGDPALREITDGPKGIAATDFDLDGKTDLAVGTTDGSVTVLFGRGDGRMAAPLYLRAQAETLRGIVTADFNGDSHPDIAVASPHESRICLFLNGGARTFAGPQFVPAWHGVRNLAVGDFDGDGIADILAAGPNMGLQQFKNTGLATFAPVATLGELNMLSGETNVFPKPVYSLAVFRPNGSLRDWVFATHAEAQQVWLLAPNELGILEIREVIPTSATAHAVVAAPVLNSVASGITDLVVVQRDAGALEIFPGFYTELGYQTGNQAAQRIGIPGGPRAAEVADLNLDGWNDLVIVQRYLDSIITYFNNAGTLNFSTERPVGRSPRELVAARLDSDGYPDVAVANRQSSDVTILTASPGAVGYRGVNQLYLVDGNVVGLTVRDFNGDGRDDVIQLHRASGDFSVRLANPDGSLRDPVFYTAGNVPSSQVFADVNNDGIRDEITANLGTIRIEKGWVAVRLGNGNGTFGAPQTFQLPADTDGRLFALVPADFDRDGNIDLAAGFLDSRIAFFRGLGDGRFVYTRTHPFVQHARALIAGDFDADGDLDLAGVGASSEMWVVENQYPTNLLTAATLGVQRYPRPSGGSIASRTIYPIDHNQDGDLDLVIGSGNGAWLYLGGPGTTFQSPQKLAGTESFVSDFLFADVDRDGNKDLLISCKEQDCLSVFTRSGNGEYRLSLPLQAPASKFIATGDLDGDGLPDIVGSGRVLWTVLSSRPPQETPPLLLTARREGLAKPVINEILAVNTGIPLKEDNNRNVDWVELFNGGDTSFSLNGWRLRLIAPDDNGVVNTNEFRFPVTAFFGRSSRVLVVFTKPVRTPYHTGFSLPAEGGRLTLINAAGIEVDDVNYPPQRSNVSYGRYRDGLPSFVFNPFPSPGEENRVNGDLEPDFKFTGVTPSSMQPGQPLKVFAEANDDIAVTTVTMFYQRLDEPNSEVMATEMFDDGLHDDGAAGDGLFAGEVSDGFPSGAELQFYFEVRDLDDTTLLFPDEPEFGLPGAPGNAYQLGIGAVVPPIEISEVVADNLDGLEDEFGGTPDWVEVRNTSSTPVSLDGVTLAHQLGDTARYHFPPGTLLEPGQHFIVYCDNNPDQGPLHAPLRMDKTSDLIMLTGVTTNGSRTLIDWSAFTLLGTDQAWARLGAGGSWRKCSPTPFTGNLVEPWLARLEPNGVVAFAFPTEPDRAYIVEHCTNLTDSATWQTIGVYTGTGLEEVIRKPAATQEFFRVRRE